MVLVAAIRALRSAVADAGVPAQSDQVYAIGA
jgi:hypothetical protein